MDALAARRLKRAPPWCIVSPVANVIARGCWQANRPWPEAGIPPELVVARHG